ncbi:MAG: hypothetical protein KJ630_14220 [Proteobacteria bacterium]|nr:hypothetical protein [Pseudomonadota bacterium]
MLLYFEHDNEVISSDLLTRICVEKSGSPCCGEDFAIVFYFNSIDVGFLTIVCQNPAKYEGLCDFMEALESNSKSIAMCHYFSGISKFIISNRKCED